MDEQDVVPAPRAETTEPTRSRPPQSFRSDLAKAIASVALASGLAVSVLLERLANLGLGTSLIVLTPFAAAVAAAGRLAAKWFDDKEREQAQERELLTLERAADRLRERMELASLFDYNRALLDRYHGIATEQAQKAYRSSRVAMGVGLTILVVAFFAGWRLNAQGDRLFVGSVAAVGTAFTAYLGRTYMLTYERALQQLNEYFNQPVMNGYFLAAERIAESLPPEQKAVMLEEIIREVLANSRSLQRRTGPGSRMRATRSGRGTAEVPPARSATD